MLGGPLDLNVDVLLLLLLLLAGADVDRVDDALVLLRVLKEKRQGLNGLSCSFAILIFVSYLH